MNFDYFISKLKYEIKMPLPGLEAQLKMAPKIRAIDFKNGFDSSNATKSSVLILLYPDNSYIKTVFIQRSEYGGIHSGQVSYPGGRFEKSDKDLIETAFRESKEEIGVDPKKIHLIGTLSELYIPPSNYIVLPVIGFMNERANFIPDPKEVRDIVEVKITDLLDKGSVKEKAIPVLSQSSINAPFYNVSGLIIWGATAMITSEFVEIVRNIYK